LKSNLSAGHFPASLSITARASTQATKRRQNSKSAADVRISYLLSLLILVCTFGTEKSSSIWFRRQVTQVLSCLSPSLIRGLALSRTGRSGLVVIAPACGVRGHRFESHRGLFNCVYRDGYCYMQPWARAAPYCSA